MNEIGKIVDTNDHLNSSDAGVQTENSTNEDKLMNPKEKAFYAQYKRDKSEGPRNYFIILLFYIIVNIILPLYNIVILYFSIIL